MCQPVVPRRAYLRVWWNIFGEGVTAGEPCRGFGFGSDEREDVDEGKTKAVSPRAWLGGSRSY